MDKKALVRKYRSLVSLACRVHNLFGLRLRQRGRDNRITAHCALIRNSRIHIHGNGNRVIIGDFCQLDGCTFHISGNNNTVIIQDWCTVKQGNFWMEDSGNTVTVGEHTRMLGNVHLAAIEGTSITIGRDCLFSDGIQLRTGDSHSILDLAGKRINPSLDISLGDHVWVGNGATCLKGTVVADHCIIGTKALVAGSFSQPNCVIAGVPAKVLRSGVDWDIRRLPVEAVKD